MVRLYGPQSGVESVPNLTKYFKDHSSLSLKFQILLSSLLGYEYKQVILWKQAKLHIFNIPRLAPLIQ